MFKKVSLAFRVFRCYLLIVSVILTAIFVFVIYRNIEIDWVLQTSIIWRTLIFAPVLYWFNLAKKSEFVYYRNLGLSKLGLIIYIFIFDILLTIAILNISYAII